MMVLRSGLSTVYSLKQDVGYTEASAVTTQQTIWNQTETELDIHSQQLVIRSWTGREQIGSGQSQSLTTGELDR